MGKVSVSLPFLVQGTFRPYSHETFWHIILRYCDKKIILRHMFQWATKISSEKTYLDFFKELTLAYRDPWLKNIFLSQYLFIAILCAKMSRVNKALRSIKYIWKHAALLAGFIGIKVKEFQQLVSTLTIAYCILVGNHCTGGPRYMQTFYLQFRVHAIQKCPFFWNLSSN